MSDRAEPQDIVGIWDVPLQDGVHRIEFEHGTTTGKRVIRVDGKVHAQTSTPPKRTEFASGSVSKRLDVQVGRS